MDLVSHIASNIYLCASFYLIFGFIENFLFESVWQEWWVDILLE
jgi:hypothetical protein